MENYRDQMRQIDCEPGCANCCPTESWYRCRWLDEDNLCEVHPSVVSDEIADRNRGIKCHVPPVELFSWYHYCPPVARFIEEHSDVKVESRTLSSGQVRIANWDEVSPIYEQLMGFDRKKKPAQCMR